MITQIKAAARRYTPGLFADIARFLGNDRPYLTRQMIRHFNMKIQDGPFEGMAYLNEATGSALLPKLIGSYEAELYPWVEQIISKNYATIIDVGCAEGYYAIGLARRLPQADVRAYDTDPTAQKLCAKLAAVNGVESHLTIAGHCDPEELNRVLSDRALVICDCEGYEIELLDPIRAPNLHHADILVELHDHVDSNISQTILTRFAESHNIDLVSSGDKDSSQFQALSGFSAKHCQIALDEHRPCVMQWAFLTAKT